MLRTEWEHDLEMEAMAEEALETGLEQGVQQGQVEILALINCGYTVEQLKNLLTSRLNSAL